MKTISLQVPVSNHCNNNCVFCLELRNPKGINLDKRHIEHIIKTYSNTQELVFVAKEPTLNPHLPYYISLARERGFKKIAICTNARRLSYKSYCQQLLSAGLNRVIVSIHADNARAHDGFTRTPGSFNQTLEGLNNMEQLKKFYRIELHTSTVITKLNYRFLDDILDFLRRFDLDVIVLNVAQPRGDNMRKFFSTLMPVYSEVSRVFAKFYYNNRQLFKNNMPSVAFQAIPPCTAVKSIRNFFGMTEAIIKPYADGKPEFIPSIFSRESDVIKRKTCNCCMCNSNCEGVPRIYIDHFGWDEFRPVTE